MIATQLDSGGAQLNVLDIEAFKQKYNIPDSEEAVKFVQTPTSHSLFKKIRSC